MKKHTRQSGFSLVEILVAISIIGIVLGAAVGSLGTSQDLVHIGRNKSSALGHMSEYYEYIKNIKRYDWDLLTNGRFIVVRSGNDIVLQPTVTGETINGFTRYVDIDTAYRDSSGTLTTDPMQTPDESAKRITVTVSWGGIRPGTLTNAMYVTRFLDNLSWEQTTESDFTAGTHTGTTTVNNAGGEVILGAGGFGNWCTPNLTSTSYDLSGNGIAQGVWAVEGRAFIGTGDNASGLDFINVAINNPPQPTPPSITEQGTYDQNLKTNDVFGETVSGTHYAYLATNSNGKEVVILNASNNPPTQVSSIDVSGSSSANSVFVSNNLLYVVAGSKLFTYDITTRSSPQSRGNVSLHAVGKNVFVVGEYAYVAESDSTHGLEIIRVTNNGLTLSVVGYANVNGESGQDVFVNQSASYAYLITTGSSSKPEFFLIDISTPTGSRPTMGTYDTSGMNPKAITVTPGNNVIIVGHGGIEYQVLTVTINNSNEATITQCGAEDSPDNLNGVSTVLESDGDAYSYVITQNSTAEFRIIVGGPGGNYSSSGVFESSTFDPGRDTIAFNQFVVNHSEPINTTVRYQVALVDGGVSGACSDAVFNDFTFVGPDGTSTTFFTTGGAIPTNDDGSNFENPGRCLRYRVYLDTTDYVSTPIFSDITVNYSP